MIAVAFEAAIRRTALVQLDVRHYSTDKFKKIEIPLDKEGVKTGHGRKRPLSWSAGYLEDWLSEEHPEPDNPDAPLFTSLRPQDAGKRLSGHSFYTMMRRVTDKSDKLSQDEVHPHALRHARATQLRTKQGDNKDLNKTDIEVILGWEEGTAMHQRYEHIGDDKEAEIAAKKLGMEVQEEEDEVKNYIDECPQCGRDFPDIEIEHCPQCGLKLSNEKVPWWKLYQRITTEEDILRQEYDERISAVPHIHNMPIQNLDHVYAVFLLSEQLMYDNDMFETDIPDEYEHISAFESEEDADQAMKIINQRIKPKIAQSYDEDPSRVRLISDILDSDPEHIAENMTDN